MKRFLKHTLCSVGFLAGLMALLMLFSYAFTPKNNTREAGIDEYTLNGVYAEPENTLDVIFEGDSTSYYGINPLEIWRSSGITSYAAGWRDRPGNFCAIRGRFWKKFTRRSRRSTYFWKLLRCSTGYRLRMN